MPTFRNTICSIFIGRWYEDGTDRVFRNVGIYNSDAGNYPKENIIYSEHGESLKSRILMGNVSIDGRSGDTL